MKSGDISNDTIAVEGLRDLMRALKEMDKTTRKEVRAKLREVGKIVADEAKSQATSKMTQRSGNLVRSIKVSVTQRSVSIVAGALKRSAKYPSGYNYPKRHEYGSGGKRAFMNPALEDKQEEVIERFEEILDELEKEWASD
jgi:HK97 gp10 family phage protein